MGRNTGDFLRGAMFRAYLTHSDSLPSRKQTDSSAVHKEESPSSNSESTPKEKGTNN